MTSRSAQTAAIAALALLSQVNLAHAQDRHAPSYGAQPEEAPYGRVLLTAGLLFEGASGLEEDKVLQGTSLTVGYALNRNIILGLGLKQGNLQSDEDSAQVITPTLSARAQFMMFNTGDLTTESEFRLFARGGVGPAFVGDASAGSELNNGVGLNASLLGGMDWRPYRETSFYLALGYSVWSLPTTTPQGQDEMTSLSGITSEIGIAFNVF